MMIARACGFMASLILVVGCGSGSRAVPVSGVVTLDGKPLSNAHVAFQPEATKGSMTSGAGSYGITDASGMYTLRMIDNDQSGAVIGTHRVEINLRQEGDDRDPKLRPPPKTLPAKYNRQTELQFKVEPGGSSAANFDLKSQ